MHYPMFSHASKPPTSAEERKAEERVTALYCESELPIDEAWAALTDYIHLWWPRELLQSEESHVYITDENLLEETENGEIIVLGNILHNIPNDVLSFEPAPGNSLVRFVEGREEPGSLSFILDNLVADSAEAIEETEILTIVEITSGTYSSSELDDEAELGLWARHKELGRILIGAYSRFIGAVSQEEVI